MSAMVGRNVMERVVLNGLARSIAWCGPFQSRSIQRLGDKPLHLL